MEGRRYPGYDVAAVSTVALILTAPGQTMLVSLLNPPIREAYGFQPITINTAYTLATIAASLPLVWVGALCDRYGPRRMLMVISVAFGLACLFTAGLLHWAQVFAAFFLLRFLGQGSLSLVSGHALAMWFDRRLGSISGLRQVALFVGWAGLAYVTPLAMAEFGWRATWAGFGVLVPTILCLLAWRFVHDRPEDLGFALDGPEPSDAPADDEPGFTLAQAWRTPSYWLLVVTGVLPPMVITAVLFDMQPLLIARGIATPDDASLRAAEIVSLWSLTMAVMAIPSGAAVDRLAPGALLAAGAGSLAGGCVLWLMAGTQTLASGAMVAMAVGQSLVMSTVGATTARYFGRAHHGAIRSSLTRLGVIGTGLGPLVFGLSQQLGRSFDPALIGFAAICAPAAAASLRLGRPSLPPPDAGEQPAPDEPGQSQDAAR